VTIKVLIIDEQPNQNDPSIDLLAKGFSVNYISFGIDLESYVQKLDPDVMIINSSKPNEEKINSYWNLRAISKAPILVLSVVDEPGIVEKVLDRGADEYLLKPVSPNLLAARINALARRAYFKKTIQSSTSSIKTTPLPR